MEIGRLAQHVIQVVPLLMVENPFQIVGKVWSMGVYGSIQILEAFLASKKRFVMKLLHRLVCSWGFINLNDSAFSWLQQQLFKCKKVIPILQFHNKGVEFIVVDI